MCAGSTLIYAPRRMRRGRPNEAVDLRVSFVIVRPASLRPELCMGHIPSIAVAFEQFDFSALTGNGLHAPINLKTLCYIPFILDAADAIAPFAKLRSLLWRWLHRYPDLAPDNVSAYLP